MRPVEPPLSPEPTPDRELGRVLEEWNVPALPETLDRRVMASFHAHVGRRSLWRRFVTSSVRIPLPVAVAALLLLALALLLPRRPAPAPIESAASESQARTARLDSRPMPHGRLAGFEPVSEMSVTVLPPTVSP